MLDVGVKEFANAKVHTITIGKIKLYWLGMCDVQERLAVKNIHDFIRKETCGIFKTNNPPCDQIRKHKRCGKEFNDNICTYARSDLILKIIMCNRGSKKNETNEKASEFKS